MVFFFFNNIFFPKRQKRSVYVYIDIMAFVKKKFFTVVYPEYKKVVYKTLFFYISKVFLIIFVLMDKKIKIKKLFIDVIRTNVNGGI